MAASERSERAKNLTRPQQNSAFFRRGVPAPTSFKHSRACMYEMVPEELMNDLYKFYEWDFRLFGYDIEPFLR